MNEYEGNPVVWVDAPRHPNDTSFGRFTRDMWRTMAIYLRDTSEEEPLSVAAIDATVAAHMPAPAEGWRIRIVNHNGRDLETIERAKVLDARKPHPAYMWCKCSRCRKARATVTEA